MHRNELGRYVSDESPVLRFLNKIEIIPDGCWLWNGSINQISDYGIFWETHTKAHLAHRLMYELIHGDINNNKVLVRHKCDIRNCVNPDHLELGSHLDNAHDRIKRGRSNTRKGSSHTWAKITEQDVLSIRQQYNGGKISQQSLATQFGLSQTAIGQIIRRERWKHM